MNSNTETIKKKEYKNYFHVCVMLLCMSVETLTIFIFYLFIKKKIETKQKILINLLLFIGIYFAWIGRLCECHNLYFFCC